MQDQPSAMFTCMTRLQLSTGDIVRYAVSDITNAKVDGAISALVHDTSTHWVDFPANNFNISAMERYVAYRLEREPLAFGAAEQRNVPRKMINGVWQSASVDVVRG
jgi:hypothetical protein